MIFALNLYALCTANPLAVMFAASTFLPSLDFYYIPIGIMSNGYGVIRKKDDESFWEFIRENKVVWRITTYDVSPEIYIKLFKRQHCLDLLSLDINNRFSNLAVLTETEQEITAEKYRICGLERLNIFVRNGRIWKCPSAEYIDLFNGYFGKRFTTKPDDYLEINEKLTREEIMEFKNRRRFAETAI